MDTYNHFAYGMQLATQLKSIQHAKNRPGFFEAFGIEDLYNLSDKISAVKGTILIAVDGYESSSLPNGADGLNDALQYAFIVATTTINDRPETISQAFAHCRPICKQIRNKLFNEASLQSDISRETHIHGIGPIGDNMYGCILNFTINQGEDFFVDPSYFIE